MNNDDPMVAALDRAVARYREARQPREGEQVLSGAYGTADYAAIMSCYRQHQKLSYQGVLYRVRWVERQGDRFRAGVRRCQKQPQVNE